MQLWKDDEAADAEQKLWSGSPNVGQWLIRLGALPATSLAVLGLICTILMAVEMSTAVAFAFGTLFLVFPGVSLWGAAYEARNTRYVVTNRRIIRSGGYSSKPDIPIAALSTARLVDFGNGCGSVVIGPGQVLHCIPNAIDVYNIIQSALADGPTHQGWSTGPIPCWPSDPFVSRLAPGEKHLWSGMPDIGKYAEQFKGYVASVTGMPSTFGPIPRDVAASVCYAITNYRALIHVRYSDDSWMYICYDLTHANLAINTDTDDIGSIRFLSNGRYVDFVGWTGRDYPQPLRYEHDFIHLRACSKAFEAINKAVRERSPEASKYASHGFTKPNPMASAARLEIRPRR